MNKKYKMNTGIKFNMTIDDIGEYIQTFKVGTGSHSVLTDSLTDLDEPFFTSSTIEYVNDATHSYFICTLEQTEANDTPITEIGLFSGGGELAFYIKNPVMVKKDSHTLVFKIKVNTVI